MFDKKKQKSCVKHIHLVTDDGLYDWKAFYKGKKVFLFILYEWWQIYQLLASELVKFAMSEFLDYGVLPPLHFSLDMFTIAAFDNFEHSGKDTIMALFQKF